MNSLSVNPIQFSFSRNHASQVGSKRPRFCSSFGPFRSKSSYERKLNLGISNCSSSKADNSNGSGDSVAFASILQSKSRKDILLEYVKNVQPEFMELFSKRASQQVVDAMRQTVTAMVGSLPQQFFAVTITTVAEHIAQLMYTVMLTGYMFKNAQYRLELQKCLDQAALPGTQDKKGDTNYAPRTQKNVTGEVIRWNHVSGPERIDAKKYIELLETQVEELKREVSRKTTRGQNELLEYLNFLEPHNLKELSSGASEDVVLAMNTFIKRLMAFSDSAEIKTTVAEGSASDMGRLLYWLMVVGYSIRNIEVRLDMERAIQMGSKHPELPSGEST